MKTVDLPSDMPSPIVQYTTDGSHTLYIPELDEHYHSVNGAVQEARHVYIEAAFNQYRKQEIRVLEMGFGTGLNVLLTLLEARKREVRVIYTALDKYPLPAEILNSLNYVDIDKEMFAKIHAASWNAPVHIEDFCTLHKVQIDFHDYEYPGKYDVVYYDAFGPDKQSDVWDQSLFDIIHSSMNSGGILSTYCAKGEIRRRMKNAGFEVHRLEGPPGKREMLQAVKP
ncbi:MAG: tRNA (5-methylaminomethyl-2-thiouridine)(34)-methyltransferase MnmD [Bacteroidales bacterium]|nr:tRNA (5-methylaminomethyl-2-thiouridine)(34)-methyltransferase MnmD [Bacteroidales bacterium]